MMQPILLKNLTSNISGKPQIRQLDGRDHLVIPMAMIVPGVLNGSKGKGLYTQQESIREMDAWNNMPIVVNHPVDNEGDAISARTPEVLDRVGIGRVFNANWNGKLRAMAWVDVEKAKKLVPSEFAKLKQGKPVELSTGVFIREEPVQNGKTDDGKDYDWVARDIKPDHLALLTGTKGACSLNDGCGLNVNQEAINWDDYQLVANEELVDAVDLDSLAEGDKFEKVILGNEFKWKITRSLATNEDQSPFIDWDEFDDVVTGNQSTVIIPEEKPMDNSGWFDLFIINEDDSHEDCECGGECDECKDKLADNDATLPVRAQIDDSVTSSKACQILKDGVINGKPITNKQRRLFGAVCNKQTNNETSSMEWLDLLNNAFCPTGDGGGIDPSCGSGGKSGGGGSKKDPNRTKKGKVKIEKALASGEFGEGSRVKVSSHLGLGSGSWTIDRVHSKSYVEISKGKKQATIHTSDITHVRNQSGEFVINQQTTNSLQGDRDMKSLTKEQKEKIVSDLITNEGVGVEGPWKEDHRKALEAMPEDQLLAFNSQRELLVNAMTDDDDEEEEDEEEGDDKGKKKIPAFIKKKIAGNCCPEAGGTSNKQEVIANWLKDNEVDASPEEAGAAMREAIIFNRRRRDKATKTIVANSELTESWCSKQEVPVLEHMATKLAANEESDEEGDLRTPSYAGAGGRYLIGNAQEDDFRNQDQEMGLLGLNISAD